MKCFVLSVALLLAVCVQAAPPTDFQSEVVAGNLSGKILSPTNFFWTNIINGSNVVIERLPAGRIKVHSTGGGGGAGETNTTSNTGDGVGIAAPKSGVNFPFKSFKSANSLATWSTNGTNITLTVNVDSVASNRVSVAQGTNIVVVTNAVGMTQVYTVHGTASGSGETNWVFDGSTLRPQTANSVTVTNLDVWTRFIAKGAVIYETRSRTLALGTNSLSISTNALLLLDSPTNAAAQVVIQIQNGISSGQFLIIVNNATNKAFTLYDTGPSGTMDISGDFVSTNFWRGIQLIWNGTQWIEATRFNPGSAPPTGVNPTIGFLPFNQDGSTFGDSPIQRVTTAPFNAFTNDPGVIVNGILKAHSYLLATTIGVVSGDPTGFGFNSDPSFYRMIVTNSAATNRTFTLGAQIYSNQPNDIAECLLEFNGGAAVTLSNSGTVLLLTNWVPIVQGERLKLNWNNYNAKWEEQWRYPAITTNATSSSTGSTNFINLSVQAAKLPTTNYPAIDAGNQDWELYFYKTNAEGSIALSSATWQTVVPQDYATNTMKLRLLNTLVQTNGVNSSNTVFQVSIYRAASGSTNDVRNGSFGAAVSVTNVWAASASGTNRVQTVVADLGTNSFLAAGDFCIVKVARDAVNDTFGGITSLIGLQLEYTRP